MALIGWRGSLLWRGDTGSSALANESCSYSGPAPDATKFGNFASAIKAYSKCNLTHKYRTATYSEDLGAPGTNANIDRKAVIYYRNPSDLSVNQFQYPEPLATDIEDTPWGKRIKETAIIAIVTLLSTMAEVSYIPMYGVYYQRK